LKRFVVLLVLLYACPAQAFLTWQGPRSQGDLRALLRGFGAVYEYPDESALYPDNSAQGVAGVARLMSLGTLGERLGFEFNALQSYLPSDLLLGSLASGAALDTERSAELDWSYSDDDYLHLAVDRLNARFSAGRLDARVGRQPINLATTFYFTPNDFFAPFAAQTFFRVYKPGVDALRADYRIGALSTLSAISVLGYTPDARAETGWSGRPDADRTSYLGRLAGVVRDVEVVVLAGRVRRTHIFGASLQGEWFEWLGVRAEGHFAAPRDGGQSNYTELNVGFEHRWPTSLELRLEYFHHGSGADDEDDYELSRLPDTASYLGRRYLALGAGYEFTPLLRGEALAIANLVDQSRLLSLYAVYSLSDEAELALNLGLPFGDEPEGTRVRSEFGLFPRSGSLELRVYF
jgi:hypothetical protein